MIPIIKPNEMYNLDSYLIDNVGIPSMLLMENAAFRSSSIINTILPAYSKILILCGIGNNGGDGLALVRHLNNNYKVEYLLVGDREKQSNDNKSNLQILINLGINELTDDLDYNTYDCIIDSLFGIGMKLPLKTEVSQLIEKVNSTKSLKIAIDLPTGLDSLTGKADISTFKADYTLTMYAGKTGLLLNDGKDYSGIVNVLDLGIPIEIIYKFSNFNKYIKYKHLIRKSNSSKFDYGKCLIIAGSESMSGAAALTANAAISAGAGLVYLCTTTVNQKLFPEIITKKIENYTTSIYKDLSFIEIVNKCDSIVIGPGLGKSESISNMVNYIIDNYKSKNIIIDADAISVLNINSKYNNNITITPHIGEFSNLIGIEREIVANLLPDIVMETAKKMNLNILLKGSTTVLSDGEELLFVSDGVPQMATAGSGDVLSGILGAQINHGICDNNLQNIANACLLHVEAAKYSLISKSNIVASDIIEGIKCIK